MKFLPVLATGLASVAVILLAAGLARRARTAAAV
jgi:hypothetical protein